MRTAFVASVLWLVVAASGKALGETKNCPSDAKLRAALRLAKTAHVSVNSCVAGRFPAKGVAVSLVIANSELDLVVIDDRGKLIARGRAEMSPGQLERTDVSNMQVADLDGDRVDEVLISVDDIRTRRERKRLEIHRIAKSKVTSVFEVALFDTNNDGSVEQDAVVECFATFKTDRSMSDGQAIVVERHLKRGPKPDAAESISANCLEGTRIFTIGKKAHIGLVLPQGNHGEVTLTFDPKRISADDLERAIEASQYGWAATEYVEAFHWKCNQLEPTATDADLMSCLQLPEVGAMRTAALDRVKSVLTALSKPPTELRDNSSYALAYMTVILAHTQNQIDFVSSWNVEALKRPIANVDVATACAAPIAKIDQATTKQEKYKLMQFDYSNCVIGIKGVFPPFEQNVPKTFVPSWKAFLKRSQVKETRLDTPGAY